MSGDQAKSQRSSTSTFWGILLLLRRYGGWKYKFAQIAPNRTYYRQMITTEVEISVLKLTSGKRKLNIWSTDKRDRHFGFCIYGPSLGIVKAMKTLKWQQQRTWSCKVTLYKFADNSSNDFLPCCLTQCPWTFVFSRLFQMSGPVWNDWSILKIFLLSRPYSFLCTAITYCIMKEFES